MIWRSPFQKNRNWSNCIQKFSRCLKNGVKGVNEFPTIEFFHQLTKNGTKDEIATFNTFLFELEDQNCTSPNGLYFQIYNQNDSAKKVDSICTQISTKIESNPDSIGAFLSIYLHCQLKMGGMGKTLLALSNILEKSKNISHETAKSGIKFLAVMQQVTGIPRITFVRFLIP